MNVLFVCKYNRFRSRIAEVYFNKVYKNHKAKSTGLIGGGYPLDAIPVKTAKEMGFDIEGKIHPLSIPLLKWADLVVVVASDVPLSLFNHVFKVKPSDMKVISWNIPDDYTHKPEATRNLIRIIMKKVDNLNKELKC